ncbi:MAG: hypothetical protein JF593_01540 [Novosphingobium sp.]|nr:hypothetical protein [Novosphingobium sp.]
MNSSSILIRTAVVALAIIAATPVQAGWKLIPANTAQPLEAMKIVPQSDWNQASRAPGRQGQMWTHDGFELNGLELFAGVPAGQPLYRERNVKKNPMPKFDKGMLLPDLADFFERSFRAQNQVSDFTVETTEPTMLGIVKGIALRYRYSLPGDELVRRGEVRLAIKDAKLYVVNFYAPSLHYFDAGLPEAHAIMDAARF